MRRANGPPSRRNPRSRSAGSLELRQLGVWAFALDLHPLDLLWIKAAMVIDSRALQQQFRVAPYRVIGGAAGDPDRPE